MTGETDNAPRVAWRWALCGLYALVAGINLPGQMSFDSVIALAEGRSGQRITWGPPMYSAILGFFDAISPGTGLYVTASLLLFLGAWAALARLRPRLTWAAPVLLVVFGLFPQVLIYQGIVWKDVLFANLAIAGFVAIAWASLKWEARRLRWAGLVFAAFALALGALVRQNGAITFLFSGLLLGWIAWPRDRGRALAWAAAGFVVPLVLMGILAALTPVRDPPNAPKHIQGVRFVQTYDLVAALAADPSRPMPALQKSSPQTLALLRAEAPRVYTPVRSDTLDQLKSNLGLFSDQAISSDWFRLIGTDPLGYASRRLDMFRWVFLTPDIDQCLPFEVGIDGPAKYMRQLSLTEGERPQDEKLWNYGTWWLDTPVLSHAFYAAVAAAAAAFLLWRREAADVAIAALCGSALAHAASFYVISLACDYRYMYFLDLSAMTAVLYIAIDPRLRRRRSG